VSQDPADWAVLEDRALIERYTLVLLYFATEGDLWTVTLEWLSDLSICDWFGVACTLDGFVSDLVLGKWQRNHLYALVINKCK
jgi:hypothetical protein